MRKKKSNTWFELVSLEESEFLDWVRKKWPVDIDFADLSASGCNQKHAREFFFRTHECNNNQFMHLQAGFYRKGFHSHELMCMLTGIDPIIASLYGHSERVNREYWLLRALPFNDFCDCHCRQPPSL